MLQLKGGLYLNGEMLCFNEKEDNLLNDNKDIYMVDKRGSLQCEKLANTTSQYVGVREGDVSESTQQILEQLRESDSQINHIQQSMDDLRTLVLALQDPTPIILVGKVEVQRLEEHTIG